MWGERENPNQLLLLLPLFI
uniref:Uncharacterized protein n=1 Tax=Rhizophora mucronata TaxID=61149 RepID=A0A2P2NU23_RHIMU